MKAALDTAIAGGLFLAVAFTVLAFGAVEAWSLVLFEFLVLGIGALWIAKALVERELRLPVAALPLLGLLVLAIAQSVAWTGAGGERQSLSIDVEATRSTTLALACMVLAFVVSTTAFATRERLKTLAVFLTALGFGLALFALIQDFTANGKIYWVRALPLGGTPFGPFVNRNHFAGYMEMLLPIPIALIATGGLRDSRWLAGLAAAMMGVATVFSLSRGGMVGAVAALGFVFVASTWTGRAAGPGSHRLARGFVVAFVLATIVAGVLWIGAEPVVNRLATGSATGGAGADASESLATRSLIWRDTADLISENPILGAGLGAFETAYPRYSSRFGETAVVRQAHNDFLQILADAGLVGAALVVTFVVLVFAAVRRGARSRDALVSGMALGSGAGLFALLVHSLFDFNLQIPSNALLFLVLSGCACATAVAAGAEPPRERIPRRAAAPELVRVGGYSG